MYRVLKLMGMRAFINSSTAEASCVPGWLATRVVLESASRTMRGTSFSRPLQKQLVLLNIMVQLTETLGGIPACRALHRAFEWVR
jgi:hypothetical protein